MRQGRKRCTDCDAPSNLWVCPDCTKLRQRINAIHGHDRQPERYEILKAPLVELYRHRAETGIPLFEDAA